MDFIEVLRSLASGDGVAARRQAVELLRHDKYDCRTWLLMAHLAEDEAEKQKCLERVRYIEQLRAEHAAPAPEDQPLEISVAAVNKESFPEEVRGLSLREPLRLRRQPDNRWDPNAILVERLNGRACGYIPRQTAAVLGPEMDQAQQETLPAYVTCLASNFYDAQLSLDIAVALAPDVRDRVRDALAPENDRRLSFCITENDFYRYLLLDCSERRFKRVSTTLGEQGCEIQSSGISTKSAPNGRSYRWYLRVRLDSEWTVAWFETLFQDEFDTLSDDELDRRAKQEERRLRASLKILERGERTLREGLRAAEEELEEAHQIVGLYSAENREKKYRIERLENTVQNVEYALEENRIERLNVERELEALAIREEGEPEEGALARLLRALFSNVTWLRDSLEVLVRQFQDPLSALVAIHVIACDPRSVSTTLKPKGVKSTNGWWELHLSTGQSNDGRLYFRQESGKVCVLVSYKRYQASDIEWLRSAG